MAEPVLDLRNVSVAVGGAAYVRDVSLSVAAGQIVGLLGPNGAGKTTLLREVYAGTGGDRVVLHGRPKRDWRRADWARAVGALVQGGGLLAGLTPWDIVDIGLKPLGLDDADRRSRLGDALRFAGLWDERDQSAETLSGGEVQRCYFAQLLARDPELYVLDEPTNHLDLHYQLKLLDEVRRRGRAVLATFHDLTIAARYCDRVAIMQQGRIVVQGPPGDVLSRAQLRDSYRVNAELRDKALFVDGPI